MFVLQIKRQPCWGIGEGTTNPHIQTIENEVVHQPISTPIKHYPRTSNKHSNLLGGSMLDYYLILDHRTK